MSELTAEKVRQQYSYYAFISYSRKDEKWAKWLQARLETYRLPAAIRKSNVDLPQRIAPVFRDKTDLAGIVLDEALYKGLEASKYLIVICSPNSAASDYVNKEIAYFASLGREKAIIPFIVDGEPFSGDGKSECFPQALRDMESELLGISVPELGKTNAFLRIVSTLLNLKYDQVVMRDTRRRIRRNVIITAAALVLSVVTGGVLWYNMPHVKYYNAYVYRNEIPVGIYELSPAERKVSHDHYRITTQRGKVIKLECVNSAGLPDAPAVSIATREYPILEFVEYDSSGRLLSVNQRDQYGQLVSTKDLSYSDATNQIAIDFHIPGSGIQAYAMSSDMSYLAIGNTNTEEKSEITRYMNTYSDEGLLIKSMYHKGDLGTPACDSNGVYGKLYEYNGLGQITRISNLNADGEIHNCKYGWAAVEYVYDDRGNYTQEFWYDAEGNRVPSERNCFSEKVTYDENNNLVLWQSLDENGHLFLCIHEMAEQRWEYDARGFVLSEKSYDAQGEPTYNYEGYHEIRYEYDKTGRCVVNSYYDTDSEPMFVPEYSCSSCRVKLDDAGRITELWNYDTEGNLVCDTTVGAYGYRLEYDENGYRSAIYYLDEHGKLTTSKYGYASAHDHNNALGNSEQTEYRDEKGNLVRDTTNVAIVERTYDPVFGHWISTRYYDENENPCYYIDGYGGEDYEYENGNLVSIKYVDLDGDPMLCKEGYHEARDEYENGKCIRSSYLDTNGNLVALEDGHAVIENTYDDYGNIIEKNYFDANLDPVDAPNVYRIVNEYDERSNKTRETGYSVEEGSLLFEIAVYEYDEHDNQIRQSLYDSDGNLIEGTEDFPSETVRYFDSRNNLIREEYLGPDGRYQYHDEPEAINIIEYRYDDQGREVLNRYLHADASGNETFLYQYAYVYDVFGNICQEDFLDADGALRNRSSGYARIVAEYDAAGNKIVQEYYDEDGNPTVDEDYCFRQENDYNVYGEVIEIRSYDVNGNLLSEADGLIACYRCKYDDLGNMTRLERYDEYGNLYGIAGEDIAIIEYEFDSDGNAIRIIGYDCEGTYLGETTPD